MDQMRKQVKECNDYSRDVLQNVVEKNTITMEKVNESIKKIIKSLEKIGVKIIFNFAQLESEEVYEIAEVGKMFRFGDKTNPGTKKTEQDRRKVKMIEQSKSCHIIYFEDMSFIEIYSPNMVYYENTLNKGAEMIAVAVGSVAPPIFGSSLA